VVAAEEVRRYRVVTARGVPGSFDWSRSVARVRAHSQEEARELGLERLRAFWGEPYRLVVQYTAVEAERP